MSDLYHNSETTARLSDLRDINNKWLPCYSSNPIRRISTIDEFTISIKTIEGINKEDFIKFIKRKYKECVVKHEICNIIGEEITKDVI